MMITCTELGLEPWAWQRMQEDRQHNSLVGIRRSDWELTSDDSWSERCKRPQKPPIHPPISKSQSDEAPGVKDIHRRNSSASSISFETMYHKVKETFKSKPGASMHRLISSPTPHSLVPRMPGARPPSFPCPSTFHPVHLISSLSHSSLPDTRAHQHLL